MEEKQELSLEQKISQLDLFVGNLAEYTSLKRQEGALLDNDAIVIMPLLGNRKFVYMPQYDFDLEPDREFKGLFEKLIKDGCIGLIHYHPTGGDVRRAYGTPVKIKERSAHPFR